MTSAGAGRSAPGILYISYDGMLEPLGQSQVVAYLEKLAPGRRIHLISFEKDADWADVAARAAIRHRLDRAGIYWHPKRYHKSPSAPATAYDIAVGSAQAIRLIRQHKLGIIHARSYVAAAMALAAKRLTSAAFLFDMRGFWADERVDGGLWPRGRLYRTAKSLEHRFLLAADHVVTLTHASAKEIGGFDYLAGRVPPITVIPTCADLDLFSLQPPPPPSQPFTLGYVGSVGTWYLLDEMLRCFALLRRRDPQARLLVVNRSEQDMIRQRCAAFGILDAVELTAAEHGDMPRQIGRMYAAMALIKPAYSKIASAPTKLAEYLGCGVPCLGNSGVGDMAEVLEGRQVGVSVNGFTDAELAEAMDRLLDLARNPATRDRCREVALDLFSLERGVEAYARIYASLSGAEA
ncbi:glycosyltransferase [Sphingomonas alba]|uniref:Glycosyltransferase n=1 Tax=Sphingomonas alba TaxID=2908208 RepID=A0ABT0RJB1_9SPHN|nr:glycosyltransferase [Sphingomonas alba]MCL6682711.1 glycosyltransferase [Sphingomonas alba]